MPRDSAAHRLSRNSPRLDRAGPRVRQSLQRTDTLRQHAGRWVRERALREDAAARTAVLCVRLEPELRMVGAPPGAWPAPHAGPAPQPPTSERSSRQATCARRSRGTALEPGSGRSAPSRTAHCRVSRQPAAAVPRSKAPPRPTKERRARAESELPSPVPPSLNTPHRSDTDEIATMIRTGEGRERTGADTGTT
jgi:hypothetical protein